MGLSQSKFDLVDFEFPRKSPLSVKRMLNFSYFCVIQKLMIEWEASAALTEASGKLMCTKMRKSSDESISRKDTFIFSFTKTPGLLFTEVVGGPSKAIPIPLVDEGLMTDWQIEKFKLLPYFEDGSLNIKNCSLEIEFIEIENDNSEDSDSD